MTEPTFELRSGNFLVHIDDGNSKHDEESTEVRRRLLDEFHGDSLRRSIAKVGIDAAPLACSSPTRP